MNSQDIRNRFKKPDLDKEKERQDAELAANNIQRLTLVNEKLPQLKLSQAGTRYIRLLPQTEESEDTFSHMLAFVYVDSKKIPNHSGYMELTQKYTAQADETGTTYAHAPLYSYPNPAEGATADRKNT